MDRPRKGQQAGDRQAGRAGPGQRRSTKFLRGLVVTRREGAGRPQKRAVFPNDFVERFAPEWAAMISRVCAKT